jgi:hypothetical protein
VVAIERRARSLVFRTDPYGGTASTWEWTLAAGRLVGKVARQPPTREPGDPSITTADRKFRARYDRDDKALVLERGRRTIATIRRCGKVCALAFSPSEHLVAAGADTPQVRVFDASGELAARLAAPGKPRIWEGIDGAAVPDATESGRHVLATCFLDERRLVTAFCDGRVTVFDVEAKAPIVSLALIGPDQWAAVAPDGQWDASDRLACLQWAWDTDARTYSDAFALDPAVRRPGLLASLR